MLQLFRNPKIDFMGKRFLWLSISAVLIVVSLIVIPIFGVRRGIEFTGGTEVQVKYAEAPRLQEIRSALTAAGFPNHLVTTIGPPEDHEVYIRLGLVSETREENLTPRVVDALRTEEMRSKTASGLINLNTADPSTLRVLLESDPDLPRDDAERLASAIAAARKERSIFRSVDDVSSIPGMAPSALEFLRKRAFVGPFAVRSESYIGPAIGRELVKKAFLAILGSLAGMLVYIWFRFEFQWGLAGVLSLVHDTIITLGLFSVLQLEMSLPVVAAFLTLIGYSINDTVVVFDRIRENIRLQGSDNLPTLINESINQTLSRTVITSLLTWLVVLSLFFFGGEALRPFSFVLAFGIVIGTYSSIFIASPILIVWRRYFKGSKGGRMARVTTPARGGARKIRAGA